MIKEYLSLPFYGKGGTISKILETENNYLRVEYDLNGKEKKEKFPIPKNNRSYRKMIENFYQDVQGYLNYYEADYQGYKANRLKKKIDIKKVLLGKYISMAFVLLSVPLCFMTIKVISSVSIVIAASSISCFVATLDLSKNYKEDQKRKRFIIQYDNYNKELNDYRSKQKQNKIITPTRFNGLSSEKTNGNNLNLKKILAFENNLNNKKNVA